MNIRRFIFTVSVMGGLYGCGGDSTQFGPECGVNSSCDLPKLPPAESIVGLWDRSGELNGQTDTLYTFIGANGEYLVYDYQQDAFGTGDNCYKPRTGRIWRVTNSSRYQIELTTPASDLSTDSAGTTTIYFLDNNLLVTAEEGASETWTPPTGLARESLLLCNQAG